MLAGKGSPAPPENTPKPGFSVLAKVQCIMHDIAAAGHYMVRRSRFPEECSSMARAPVSKTGGWGFESLHSCQNSYDADRTYT